MKINLIFVLFFLISLSNSTTFENDYTKLKEISQLAQRSFTQLKSRITNIDSQPNPIKFNKDIETTGQITSNSIATKELVVNGNAVFASILYSNTTITDSIQTKELSTQSISSPTGLITINGDVIITNEVTTDSVNLKTSSFVIKGKIF